MGNLPFNNQVFPTATKDGAGTSGDSPIPSGSNNTMNRMSNGSVRVAPDSHLMVKRLIPAVYSVDWSKSRVWKKDSRNT